MNCVNQLFFARPYKLTIDARTDQRRGRIADTYDVSPRLNLRQGKVRRNLDAEIEKVLDKCGIVGEIDHEPVDSAQVRGLGARA